MKFAIVTPSYNGALFLRQTLDSVLSQRGEFDLRYHVQDGGSTDETLAILKDYESRVAQGEFAKNQKSLQFTWSSEKDRGMYDAINRGFQKVDGDIFAWINSDDIYQPDAFARARATFTKFSSILWLKGITDYIAEDASLISKGRCLLYERNWILKGIYGNEGHFLEQDSMFWRKELWKLAGPIQSTLRVAGDFDLWKKFAAHAELYSLNAPVSCFRKVEGQLSQNLVRYREEMDQVLGHHHKKKVFLELLFKVTRRLPSGFGNFLFSLTQRKKSGVVEGGSDLKLFRISGFARRRIDR